MYVVKYEDAMSGQPVDPRTLYAVIRAVRLGVNRLKAVGDALHRDIGVTASTRTVMEHLFEIGPQTVPEIARARNVTRQHIQIIADQLAEAGLAAFQANPAHRRSRLLALSREGHDAFAEMKRKERAVLAELATRLAGQDVEAARSALDALNRELETVLEGGVDER